MRVRYTLAAREHLKEIGDFIAKDNLPAANRVIQAIRQAIDLYEINPIWAGVATLMARENLSFQTCRITPPTG